MRALHLGQESVIALTDVEFKLGDFRIVACDPEDAFSLDVLHLILPEVARQEPKDKRSLQVVHVLPAQELIQLFAEDVRSLRLAQLRAFNFRDLIQFQLFIALQIAPNTAV